MAARRSQFEIYIDILKAVSEGRQKPTHVMYRANLTWKRLKKHVSFLVAHGLLAEENEGRIKIFSITPSGKDIVWYHMKIERELLYAKKATPARLQPTMNLFLRK